MILRAANEHNLCVGKSVLVGDKSSDIEAGRAAGVGKCYLVSTGHELTDRDKQQADSVLENIRDVTPLLEDNTPGQ
jgi:D-glycero-D-manno-heptose 1,7-bisphosphate phosphatase